MLTGGSTKLSAKAGRPGGQGIIVRVWPEVLSSNSVGVGHLYSCGKYSFEGLLNAVGRGGAGVRVRP